MPVCYDAWGKVVSVLNEYGRAQTTATFIGNVNPIRYRGYYYDTETKLYYLQSRYYDPETCRFVNMDAFVQTGTGLLDKNMYAYCEDNPVCYYDINGYFIGALCGAVIGGLGGLIGGGISAAITGDDVLSGMASGALGGAVGGALAGAVVDVFVAPGTPIVTVLAIGAIGGAVGGFTSSVVGQSSGYYFNNGTMDGFSMNWKSVLISSITGCIFNGIGAGFGQAQAQFYNMPLAAAIAGGFFTVTNAAVHITFSIYNALIAQTIDAALERIDNPYHLTVSDVVMLGRSRKEIYGS